MLAFLPVIIRLVAFIAVIGAIWGAWDHYVATPYIEKGEAKIKPQLDAALQAEHTAEAANATLSKERDDLKAAYADQTKALLTAREDEAHSLIEKNKALAALKTREDQLHAQIDDLRREAATPVNRTKEEACNEATRLLDGYAADVGVRK